jgi:hypothetical protein
MTEANSPQTNETKLAHENLSLIDLLAIRMAHERISAAMYEKFIEKARQSTEPVVRAMDLSRIEPFNEAIVEHLHLLTQSLDVLGEKTDVQELERQHAHFLLLAHAAEGEVSDPDVAVLPSLQALLAAAQYNEVAWGLLLALVKDAELQGFIAHFEQACARHREQRVLLQQYYEDVALGLVRRHHLASKSSRPLKSATSGRASMLFGDASRRGAL